MNDSWNSNDGNQQPYAPQQYNNQQYNGQYNNQYGQNPYGAPSGQPYGAPNMGTGYANPYAQGPVNAQASVISEKVLRTSVSQAYGEMSIALFVTAAVAYLSARSGLLSFLAATGVWGILILAFVQVGLAMYLGVRVTRMSTGAARTIFYLYAALMGFTLSSIFYAYSVTSIVAALALTAAFFLCLTMIGLTTKANLLKAGPILLVGLIVLLVAEVIMMLFPVSGAVRLVSAIGLLLFAGYTAYDAQATRAMYQQLGTSDEMVKKISILAALNLYLDFVNMFTFLLSLFGGSSNNN